MIKDKISHHRPHPRLFSPPDVGIGWAELLGLFLLGALHGDERVSLTAVLDIASLLLESDWCDSMPSQTLDYNDTDIMAKAEEFLSNLEGRGVGDVDRRWLSILVTTRRIFILPTVNALGYDRNSRMEDGIDANKYFPYYLMDQTLCMQTISGRTINKIFRDHLFQLSLTFYGGMEAIV